MSSPLPRLNRARRNPLCKLSPSIPFKQQPHNSLSSPPPLLSPLPPSLLLRSPHRPSTSNDHSHDKIVRTIHQLRQTPGNDSLLSSMATRLATVERQLLASQREIIEKENIIRGLEEKLLVKETTSHTELRERCNELQYQVTEMERFLEDYGMVWVGEEGVTGTSHAHPTDTWPLDSSTVNQSNATSTIFADLDFDKLVANIQQLNILAGEDTAVVCRNVGGASLKMIDSVPLTLYRNGLVMFQGPFRPYSDPLTRACVSDLLDGYFPSELQSRYPEGVPFKLTDMRSCDYEPTPIKARLFPGRGYTLQDTRDIPSSNKPCPLSCSKDTPTCSYQETTLVDTPSDVPHPLSHLSLKATPTNGKTVSLDKFLSRIPKRVIKADGSIIDIHSELIDTLQAPPISQPITTVAATSTVIGHAHQSSSDYVTSLRIRFPNDKQVILKMRVTDTVDQLREEIDKLIKSHDMSHDYVIKGSFPRRSLTDNEMTLFLYDLTHSGNLFIQPLSVNN